MKNKDTNKKQVCRICKIKTDVYAYYTGKNLPICMPCYDVLERKGYDGRWFSFNKDRYKE